MNQPSGKSNKKAHLQCSFQKAYGFFTSNNINQYAKVSGHEAEASYCIKPWKF